MIIIEGPDNSGKTTLANHLSKSLGLPVVHSVKPIGITTGRVRLQWMVDNPLAIYDRVSCISEAVYGPVLRRGSVYGVHHWKVLDQFLRSRPLIIFCYPSMNRAMDFGAREDMAGVRDNAGALYLKYKEVMDKVSQLVEINGGEVVFYDHEDIYLDNVEDYVYAYVARLKDHLEIINSMGAD